MLCNMKHMLLLMSLGVCKKQSKYNTVLISSTSLKVGKINRTSSMSEEAQEASGFLRPFVQTPRSSYKNCDLTLHRLTASLVAKW